MAEQKDVMQLIGTWGYDTLSLEKYVDKQMRLAKEAGDAIGLTTYTSLMALTKYAKTSDGRFSITDDMKIRPEMKEIVGKEVYEDIQSTIEEDEFPQRVLDTLYERCSNCDTVQDAEMCLRRDVFTTVVPFILERINKSGLDVSSHTLQMLIGLDMAVTEGGEDGRAEATKISNNFRTIVERLLQVVDKIIKCRETPNEDLNNVSSHIIGDVVKVIKDISEDILSIIAKPPHVWTKFSVSFGRFMVSFQLATSLGYIDYDTYNHIFEEIKSLRKSDKESKTFFGRN